MASTRPVKFEVKLEDGSTQWLSKQMDRLDTVLKVMGISIVKTAAMTVPKKSGDLQKSARVDGGHGYVKVTYGGNGIKYGAYQERGMRAVGSHVVKKYTTPGTGKNFLENAGKTVTKKGIAWLLSHS